MLLGLVGDEAIHVVKMDDMDKREHPSWQAIHRPFMWSMHPGQGAPLWFDSSLCFYCRVPRFLAERQDFRRSSAGKSFCSGNTASKSEVVTLVAKELLQSKFGTLLTVVRGLVQ